MKGRKLEAVSLTETVVAIFLLLSGVLAATTLLHISLQRSRIASQRSRAVLAAASTMARVRTWALDPVHFASVWSPYDDDSYVLAGGMSARVQSDTLGRVLYSPSSSLEANHPTRARRLNRSLVPVRVTVNWTGNAPITEVTLFSYIGEPELPIDPAAQTSVTGNAGPIAPDATSDYTAELLDASGNPILDLMFSWNLVPGTGNATLRPEAVDRSGQSMRLHHYYELSATTPAFLDGTVSLSSVARYLGRFYSNGDLVNGPNLTVDLQ